MVAPAAAKGRSSTLFGDGWTNLGELHFIRVILKGEEGDVQKRWLELLLLQSHKTRHKMQRTSKIGEKNTHLEIYVVTPAGGEKGRLI